MNVHSECPGERLPHIFYIADVRCCRHVLHTEKPYFPIISLTVAVFPSHSFKFPLSVLVLKGQFWEDRRLYGDCQLARIWCRNIHIHVSRYDPAYI